MATDLSGHVRTCEECGGTYAYEPRKGHGAGRCRSCKRAAWIERRMQAPLECRCQECGRRYVYDPRKGHTKRKCNSCRDSPIARRELKQRMVEYKGGCCQICGYDRCLRALDLHHVDPSTKRFTLGGSHVRIWDVLRAELDKCLLVCSNCHNEIDIGSGRTAGRRKSDPTGKSKCHRCGRRYHFKPRNGMTRNRCNSCCQTRATPEARRQLKQWMIEYKGGACQVCGYAGHWAALTFHHLDPRLKRFNVAGGHNYSLENIRGELDKCVLVCANCHDEIEAGVTFVPLEVAAAIRAQTEHVPRRQRRPPGRPLGS